MNTVTLHLGVSFFREILGYCDTLQPCQYAQCIGQGCIVILAATAVSVDGNVLVTSQLLSSNALHKN